MAILLDLPPELHATISAHLESDDCRALASTSRSLRHWRSYAYRRIVLQSDNILVLARMLEKLHQAVSADAELGAMIWEFHVRGSDVEPGNSEYKNFDHSRMDNPLAGLLQAAFNLRSFVFDAPRRRGRRRRHVNTVAAIFSSPLLETIALGQVSGSGDAISSSMASKKLRRVIVHETEDLDVAALLRDQSCLECAHFDPPAYPPHFAPQVTTAWGELTELSMAVSYARSADEEWAEWLQIINFALREGSLRKLKTVSIQGPDSSEVLSQLVAMFLEHHVPITSLRFLITSLGWQLFPGFGPSMLEEIFFSLPYLEVLCVDQSNQAIMGQRAYTVESWPWPGPWEDYVSAFARAPRLRKFITPSNSLLSDFVPGLLATQVGKVELLRSRVDSLLHACSTLNLVICTYSNDLLECHRTRTEYLHSLGAPAEETGVHPTAESDDFHFWIPPKDLDVSRVRHRTCCARPNPAPEVTVSEG